MTTGGEHQIDADLLTLLFEDQIDTRQVVHHLVILRPVKKTFEAKVTVNVARYTGQDPNLARLNQTYSAAPSTDPHITKLMEEELAALEPLPQRGEHEASWVSPSYTFTPVRFKNLLAKNSVGGLDADLSEGVHHAFQRIPTFDWLIPTLRLMDKDNHILSLSASRWIICMASKLGEFVKRNTVGTLGEESPSKVSRKEGSSSTHSGLPPPPPYFPLANQPMVRNLEGHSPLANRKSSKDRQRPIPSFVPLRVEKVKEVVHNYLDRCLVQADKQLQDTNSESIETLAFGFLKDMSLKFGHTYARLKETNVATKKRIEDLETQLGEVKKQLLVANNQVKDLK
uniref:Uncharacterized protein n=1 Tax=Cannabis sativa TaxID=3483 RepID=A0A803QEE5_CANSA